MHDKGAMSMQGLVILDRLLGEQHRHTQDAICSSCIFFPCLGPIQTLY